jgi:hypothetical protein
MRNGNGTPAACGLSLLFALGLSGCFTRDSVVRQGEKEARERVLHYAHNQRVIHAAEQKAFKKEAAAHIDTKWEWSLEKIQRTAEENKAITPKQIIDETKRLTHYRDSLNATVDEKINAIRATQLRSEKDLQNALKIQAAVERYDGTEGFDFSFLETLTGKADEPAEIVPIPPK